MAFNFYDLLGIWEETGFFDVILPFLLVFTIIYAILLKIKVLGEHKPVNVVVSFVIALLVVRSESVVGLIGRFLPNVAIFLIVILMFLLMASTLVGESKDWFKEETLKYIALGISVVFVIWALASDYLGDWLELPRWIWNLDYQTKATILIVGVFVAVIVLVTLEPTKKKPEEEEEEKKKKG